MLSPLAVHNAGSTVDLFIGCTINLIQVEFDADKRDKTLLARGLDFARAGEVFAGRHFTAQDMRQDYAEDRFVTAGLQGARLVVIVWTPRGEVRRIISMRKANDREKALYLRYLD